MKAHYLVSKELPEISGEVKAICGATIRNPQPLPMELTGQAEESLNSVRDCVDCTSLVTSEINKADGKVYFCALVEGEEAMHSGDTIERIEKLVEAKSTQQ